jgi:hypothetical protein
VEFDLLVIPNWLSRAKYVKILHITIQAWEGYLHQVSHLKWGIIVGGKDERATKLLNY